LILPLITLERTSVSKDLSKRIIPYANVPRNNDAKGGTITIARRINQKKTAEFQNNISRRKYNSGQVAGQGLGQNTFPGIVDEKTVFETITMPLPVWVSVNYEISMRTEYQQQMNDLVASFISVTGNRNSDVIEKNGWSYEIFIEQDFAENKNVDNLGEEERMFETKIQIKTLGYLIGEGINRIKPEYSARESRAQIRITRERVIVGDKRPWLNNDDFEFKE
jgi:hypothetical protein